MSTIVPPVRVKVACINWGCPSPTTPAALVYVLDAENEMHAERYFGTWAEAVAWSRDLAFMLGRPRLILMGATA